MRNRLVVASTLAALSPLAVAAQVAVFDAFRELDEFEAMEAEATVEGEALEIALIWSEGGAARVVEFTASGPLDLYFTEYPEILTDDASELVLQRLDAPGGAVVEQIAGEAAECALVPDGCFLVTAEAGPATGRAAPPSFEAPLAAGLAPGSYRLTFAETGDPEAGSVLFQLRPVAE